MARESELLVHLYAGPDGSGALRLFRSAHHPHRMSRNHWGTFTDPGVGEFAAGANPRCASDIHRSGHLLHLAK